MRLSRDDSGERSGWWFGIVGTEGSCFVSDAAMEYIVQRERKRAARIVRQYRHIESNAFLICDRILGRKP